MAKPRLIVRKLGPIAEAELTFGDLTVVVGPQATGKSILLQTLNLIIDQRHVHRTFSDHNVQFGGDFAAFMSGYYGRGMASIWEEGATELSWNGKRAALPKLAKGRKWKQVEQHAFFIPAQRVVSLPSGVSQHFSNFDFGDPWVLREFSDTVHNLLQNEFGSKAALFPQNQRLNASLREPIAKHIYGKATLAIDAPEFTKKMVLKLPGSDEGLPYLAWSAGQREFTPLLLGLYWLCPAGKAKTRDEIEWVMIEEPEMGLHPDAIATLLVLILELRRRGYRVVISTHSAVVLELVWALRELQELGGSEADVRELLALKSNPTTKAIAQSGLEADCRVYFFERDGQVRDISTLDPGSTTDAEAHWGGLVGFASRAGHVVARAVNRAEAAHAQAAGVGEPAAKPYGGGTKDHGE